MVHAVDSNADSWAASTITNNLDLLCLGFQTSSFLDGNPRTYYLIEVFNGLGTRKSPVYLAYMHAVLVYGISS